MWQVQNQATLDAAMNSETRFFCNYLFRKWRLARPSFQGELSSSEFIRRKTIDLKCSIVSISWSTQDLRHFFRRDKSQNQFDIFPNRENIFKKIYLRARSRVSRVRSSHLRTNVVTAVPKCRVCISEPRAYPHFSKNIYRSKLFHSSDELLSQHPI